MFYFITWFCKPPRKNPSWLAFSVLGPDKFINYPSSRLDWERKNPSDLFSGLYSTLIAFLDLLASY